MLPNDGAQKGFNLSLKPAASTRAGKFCHEEGRKGARCVAVAFCLSVLIRMFVFDFYYRLLASVVVLGGKESFSENGEWISEMF
ncbi:hypothetical protein CEXT_560561 [Caerostris extrusa]|uniref:Transmembrane protein n=1 Tax=Caerostris extrusa TaxID=172846 RepID=A0AAV4ME20_CAEEX|nr:hypothetical protein CEXT_560561 [Caerostris extrusa]